MDISPFQKVNKSWMIVSIHASFIDVIDVFPRLVADIEPDLIPRTGETRNEIQQRVDSSLNGEPEMRANISKLLLLFVMLTSPPDRWTLHDAVPSHRKCQFIIEKEQINSHARVKRLGDKWVLSTKSERRD